MNAYERQLAEVERAQHGLVSLRQLGDEWTRARVDQRVRARRERVGRQVYANPSVPPSFRQRVLSTVLAAGDGAFASHDTASHLWQLPLPGTARLEVTTPLERRPIIPGAFVHRSGLVVSDDLALVDGITVSNVELTIASVSSRYNVSVLGRMADDALRRNLMTLDAFAAMVERLRPAPGRSRKKLRIVLSRRLPDVELRESTLEDFVVTALDRFHLPPPVSQHEVVFRGQRRRIDHCYPEAMLALEAKGFQWYRTRSVWDRDVLRGNELQLAGYRVLGFTSAFTDREIADHVATALGLPLPPRLKPRNFAEWTRTR